MSGEDYKIRFECAADLMHAIISESNGKNNEIARLKTEIRELKEQVVALNALSSEDKSGIIQEERFNPNHDEKGRFASGNGASTSKKSRSLKIGKAEARKISSEISTNYSRYKGKKKCVHYSLWKDKYYAYHFDNRGFGDYVFTRKEKN